MQLLQHAAAQLQHPARITASAASSPASQPGAPGGLGGQGAGGPLLDTIRLTHRGSESFRVFHAREHLHDLGKLLAFMLGDQHTSPPGLAG